MAFIQRKGTALQFEIEFASGDHVKNDVEKNIGNVTKTSVERNVANNEYGAELDLNLEFSSDISEDESAYEESQSFEILKFNDKKSELTAVSLNKFPSKGIPTFQLPTSTFIARHDINLGKKEVPPSKVRKSTSVNLEDRLRCLSLNEVDPVNKEPPGLRGKNMSFTNDQMMQIERDNVILLRKIMVQQKPLRIRQTSGRSKMSNSAINRQRFQRKIEGDNLFLLRRLQQAKPCIANTHKISGCRRTIFENF
ncbi:cilia- and flagella-associated protein 97-like [Copidosoma floridanum]|uniref:cilia- and flagella-associated protein 97-like n=1 Tax=Copidosoma floridanum TaxID=29053 RepID=UPI0006C94589|nr:cilia- and flagella-associated protein 97-like [Copidosoma floridanum]